MTQAPNPSRGAGLLAQLAATGGGEAAARVAQLLTVALLGQTLGASGLGTVGLAWSLTALALAVAQAGPELAGVRLLGLSARSAPPPAAVVLSTTALKFRLALAAIPILFAIQWALGYDDPTALLQLAAQGGAALTVVSGYAWAFRGLCRPKEQAVVRTLQAFGGLLALWLILRVWPSPLAAPLAEALAGAVAALIGWRRLRSLREVPADGRDRPDPPVPGLLASALALGLANLASTLGWMAPVLAAARWATIEDVSYLTGALRLLLGGIGIIQIGFQAIYPLLVRCHAHNPRDTAGLITTLMVQSTVAAAVASTLLALTASRLALLLLGGDFSVAGEVLAALAPILIPVTFSSAVSYALMAQGESALITRIGVVSAVSAALMCVLAFQALPGPWGVLVLHLTAWGQTVAICLAGHRRGVFSWRIAEWRSLLDTRGLARQLSAASVERRP